MDPTHAVLLLGTGLAAGFIGGLIGVGGGILFAPVLLFYFEGLGIDPAVLTPLTIGTSLLCTLMVALVSTWYQHKSEAVVWRLALGVGGGSALAIFLMMRFVTTRPWYDATMFKIIFSLVLLVVVVRMVWRGRTSASADGDESGHIRWPWMAAIGSGAGMIASAVGVGGGIVLVPAYRHLLRIPMRLSVGTSSATIVVIALVGVVNYMAMGWHAPVPSSAMGYVDVGRGLLLSAPAMFSARFGVWAAQRVDTRILRYSFAALAFVVAVRMLARVFM